jgi:hypothetical protein
MSEIKKILEEQLEREKASAKKDLNTGNVHDYIYIVQYEIFGM